jgi:hypothetical protein
VLLILKRSKGEVVNQYIMTKFMLVYPPVRIERACLLFSAEKGKVVEPGFRPAPGAGRR